MVAFPRRAMGLEPKIWWGWRYRKDWGFKRHKGVGFGLALGPVLLYWRTD